MQPYHFSHLTPVGLAVLMRQAGFEIVELGYWGNKEYLHKLYTYGYWPDWSKVGGLDASGVDASFALAAQTWVLARRPANSKPRPEMATASWRALHRTVTVSDISRVWTQMKLDTNWAPADPARTMGRSALGNWQALDAGVYFPALALAEAAYFSGLSPRRLALTPHAHGSFAKVLGVSHYARWSAPPPHPGPDGPFDAVVFHAHLEYVEDPMEELAALAASLAPGGVLFGVVPTILPSAPYGGGARLALRSYTVTGLVMSAMRAGLTVVRAGYWGTNEYVDSLFDGPTPKAVGALSDVDAAGGFTSAAVSWIYAIKPMAALEAGSAGAFGVEAGRMP